MGDYIVIIFYQAALYIPLAVGSFISLSCMKIPDLSLESAFTAGAISAYYASYYMQGMPYMVVAPAVLVASCVGGMTVGSISSIFTTYGKIPHLLSSIITNGLLHGLYLLFLSGSNVSFNCTGSFTPSGVAFTHVQEYYFVGSIACLVYALFAIIYKSQMGISYSVCGRNPSFFKHHGISHNYVFITGIMLSNGLVGISGFLVAMAQGFVDTSMGNATLLYALTALIIGKTVVSNTFYIPAIGTVLYFIIQHILLHIGCDLKLFTTIQACIVMILLIIYYRAYGNKSIDHLGV